jgi:hypothetical protein
MVQDADSVSLGEHFNDLGAVFFEHQPMWL